ncbi:MAG TPA: ATP-binding protein [Trichocoleus sp.]|jgi:signal transduction histidine kinase
MLGQSSFRRILLLRILLLSIPILFLGMAVTFRKARTSLLSTARLNLEQGAIRKAEMLQSNIEFLQTTLSTASETSMLQSGSPAAAKSFLTQLQSKLPPVQCLQLRDFSTNKLLVSTCGDRLIDFVSTQGWAVRRSSAGLEPLQTYSITLNRFNPPPQTDMMSQLGLVVGTPVYNPAGQIKYTLSAQVCLKQTEDVAPWLLQGYSIVLDKKGVILAHPNPGRIGTTIAQESDKDRFDDILTNVFQRDSTGARHLFNLMNDGGEWIAGFSPLTIKLSQQQNVTWAVLTVTRLDSALQGLEEITQILLILTVGLLAAHLLAMLYMARDLALPIEQLGKYAMRIHQRDKLERVPKNFRIRELNHLAEVLDNMVGRLEERAKELESAWQEAEAANQLKSEFLANTSHELRTPLNAIIGCIRLVKDGCCDTKDEEVEFLEQADKAAIHLLKIINDLLDIQRIEEEKLPLSIETIDLRQIIKDAVNLEAVPIQQKGLELTVADLPAPIMIQADPARLKQVLLNVIYNAIKFTDKGGITIDACSQTAADLPTYQAHQNGHHHDDDDPDIQPWVVISIQDTGIGIDPAQQHKLFRPFVMVDGSTTRKFEGTGLGLAISRNLVEMMGGQITLHSAGLGQGTTVKIAMPIVSASVQSAVTGNNGTAPSMERSTIG